MSHATTKQGWQQWWQQDHVAIMVAPVWVTSVVAFRFLWAIWWCSACVTWWMIWQMRLLEDTIKVVMMDKQDKGCTFGYLSRHIASDVNDRLYSCPCISCGQLTKEYQGPLPTYKRCSAAKREGALFWPQCCLHWIAGPATILSMRAGI